MGNIFGKDCPEKKRPVKRPGPGVGWKPPADRADARRGKAGAGDAAEKGHNKLNPKDFIFTGKNKEEKREYESLFRGSVHEVLVREPGSIGGQQFIIEECSGCDVYLLDHTAALTIDACADCRIFTGPCESSVFVRDCKDCTLVLAGQQFRARDCSGCTIFLFSTTQPVIEACADLRFACYTLDYFSLAGQFAAANLSVWNNQWSRIFNFTGGQGEWSCLPPGSHHRDYASNSLPPSARQRVGYTDNTNGAVVPLTAGVRDLKADEETCFMVIMPKHVDAVLGKLLACGGGGGLSPCSSRKSKLLRTKLHSPQPAQAKSFFEGAPIAMAKLSSSAPVLGMQWAGTRSTEAAVSLLVAAGVILSPPSAQGSSVDGRSANIAAARDSAEVYMVDGREAAGAKANVFFEQWEHDKGTCFGR